MKLLPRPYLVALCCEDLCKMSRVMEALSIAFLNSHDSALLAVPSVARMTDRSWVLAKNQKQLVNYAIHNGPDAMVQRLWSRTTRRMHLEMLDGAIRVGNLKLLDFLQTSEWNTFGLSPLQAWSDLGSAQQAYARNSTLRWATIHNQVSVIGFFAKFSQFSDLDVQNALECAAQAGAADVCKCILKKYPNVQIHQALQKAFQGRNIDCIRLIMPRSDLDDVATMTARTGLKRFWPTLALQPLSQSTLSAMGRECIFQGHARLLMMLWTHAMKIFEKGLLLENVSDSTNSIRIANAVQTASSKGFLPTVKVLVKIGFPVQSNCLQAAAHNGYSKVVAQLLKNHSNVFDSMNIATAMESCAQGENLNRSFTMETSYNHSFSHSKTFSILVDSFINKKSNSDIDLQKVLKIALEEDVLDIMRMCLDASLVKYIQNLRRNHFELAHMAKKHYDILKRLEDLAGPMSCEDIEYHWIRNEADDGSVGTSDQEFEFDNEDFVHTVQT